MSEEQAQEYGRGGTQKDSYGPDEVVQVPCPYCGAESATPLFREYGSIVVVRCECSQIYTSPHLSTNCQPRKCVLGRPGGVLP